ncbi:hypothetical protein Tco_1408962 [Tanacetum coccineum]
MAGENIDNLTMEEYLTLNRGNQALGVVRPEIKGNVNFEIKRVIRDAVMLRVFPITLTGAAKRWVDRLTLGTINTWDLLKKDFIQRCQLCDGPHLDKECPLNEDAKGVEEVKYSEGRSSPFNGTKYRVGLPGYYTRVDNRPPFGEKRPSLEELINKHLEEGTSLKNLETQIEQLMKEVHAKAATKAPTSSAGQYKVVYDDAPINKASFKKANEIHEVSFINKLEDDNISSKGLLCQILPKEINPGSFTLPCTFGSLDFYVMADLGASINVMPKSMFKHLKLANLKETSM